MRIAATIPAGGGIMKPRGMTVIEMSVALVIFGIVTTSAVSFFTPLMKQRRYQSEQAEVNSTVSNIVSFVKRNRYILPDKKIQRVINPKHIYKTNFAGLNACALYPNETAFVIETAALPPVEIAVASLQALVSCPLTKILPRGALPAINGAEGAYIDFITTTQAEVYWCVTGPKRLSDAKIISSKNSAFITVEGNGGKYDCDNNIDSQSVALGETMSLMIPEVTAPAGVYYLNVYISSTPDMAGILDARSYALVVNP